MLNWVKIRRVRRPFYSLDTILLKEALYIFDVIYRCVILYKILA